MVDCWNNGQMGKANINTRILLGHKYKSLHPPHKSGSKENKEITTFQNYQCRSHFLEFSVMSKYDLKRQNMNGLLIEK